MSEFWAMGGYAAQVWSAYGITGAAALVIILGIWLSGRSAKRRLASAEAARAAIESGGEAR